VILPPQNVDDLMLREDVVAAISAGQFHLYPVANIDAGLAILTGVVVGQRCAGAWYPPDSVNGRVDAQLRRFAEQWYALQHGSGYDQGAPVSTVAHEYRNH
jgi:predicted ATP-dependent protease